MNGPAVFQALTGRAFVLHDGRQSWDASQVAAAARDLASGLAPGAVVAVLADNGPAWVTLDLACLAAGAVHLPLPAFFTPAQLRHALDSAGAGVAFTDRPEVLEALDGGFARRGEWQGLVRLERRVAAPALPAGTAKISFTSGSTGAPKGVCLRAEGLLSTASALVNALAPVPLARHLAVLPLALLLENVAGVYAPLLRGMGVHLPPLASLGWRGMAGFDPALLDAAVRQTRVQSLILVPELLKAWCGHLAGGGGRGPDGVRFVAVGGAACAPQMIQAARALGVPAHQGYGLTECGSVVCLNLPGQDQPDSVGRPLAHAALHLDETGEVHVATPAFAGYLGMPETAATSFATGDLGRLDDAGCLHLAGRRKHLLITAFGRNVAPEWPESLLNAQREVAQSLVLGEGRPYLAALLVPRPGLDEAGLAAAVDRVNAQLPDYARIGAWRAVPPFTLAEGLATGNGRPIRTAITARYGTWADELYRLKENAHDLH